MDPAWAGEGHLKHVLADPRYGTSLYRHRVPELQAPVWIGNMCYRHRTPFGTYIIIKEGGGVVPEVAQVDFSIVVTDDAHTGPVWWVRWGAI